ncbi:23S rRNA (adenine(2503)-C(2))-methyltransferase RlmN [Synechococcus sp. PCC 7336]|uniref:23S rRNA (adenine(2503)-C(2))-methyltransferase RlmN n=1 Tax=Synechococcus sp. PCC 7336 TaxID=195250 RepID=UPI00036C1E0C
MSAIEPLLGQSARDLTAWVVERGQPSFRGKQLHNWIYNKGVRSLADITVFSKAWRERVQDSPVGRSEIVERSESRDGTVKLLLGLEDGETIETVGIPSRDRLTVCVSSQVGCGMACDFCATGKGGLKRNLAVHEIVDQVLTVQAECDRRVSNIVFMGMGEPLQNFPNVLSALRCFNEDIGIGQRHITVSTIGIPKQIRRFAQQQLQVTLAVSLHAPNQSLRHQLIPSADRYPIERLIADCRAYVDITGRRVSFEYILLGGVNDAIQHAEQLADLVGGFQSHVNLLLYNPISEADYQRPAPDRVERFLQRLQERRVAASLRRSRGLDRDAACGQLRRRQLTGLSG